MQFSLKSIVDILTEYSQGHGRSRDVKGLGEAWKNASMFLNLTITPRKSRNNAQDLIDRIRNEIDMQLRRLGKFEDETPL
jgi:hypothetical protein